MTPEKEKALVEAMQYLGHVYQDLGSRISSLEGKIDQLYNVSSQTREPLSANLSKSSTGVLTDDYYRKRAHSLLQMDIPVSSKKFLESILKFQTLSVKQKATIESIAQQHNIF